MPPAKVDDTVLLDRIAEVFRLSGYAGASISQLSSATGLERASLYHRFPAGKAGMAAAIVARTAEWFEENVFEPLQGPGPAADRLRRVTRNLRAFYRQGALWCVLDSMTLGEAPEDVRRSIRGAYTGWLAAFAAIARETGSPAAAARLRAEQALIQIEGSLVVARVLGDNKPFLRVLEGLPGVLLSESNSAASESSS